MADTDYSPGELRSLLTHYARARSAVELTGTSYGNHVSGGVENHREEIIAMLCDLDSAARTLTPRQKAVVSLAIRGYLQDEMAAELGITRRAAGIRLENALRRMAKELGWNGEHAS